MYNASLLSALYIQCLYIFGKIDMVIHYNICVEIYNVIASNLKIVL